MKKIKKEEINNNNKILETQQILLKLNNRITKLENKKTNLIKDILKG